MCSISSIQAFSEQQKRKTYRRHFTMQSIASRTEGVLIVPQGTLSLKKHPLSFDKGCFFLVNDGTWNTNTMPQSAVNFMEGNGSVVAGIVKSKDDLKQMLQHKALNPILPDRPFGAELFLLGTTDIVVMLHLLLAGVTLPWVSCLPPGLPVC